MHMFITSVALLSAAVPLGAQTPSAAPVAPASASAQTTPVADGDKVRCKRLQETGSLAKVHKECHTVTEWRRLAEAEREGARMMVNNTLNSGRDTN